MQPRRSRGEWRIPSNEKTAGSPIREGTEIALLRLTGVGHGWPGGTPILSERILGPATSVIDASEELWAFFRRFSRPDAPPLN